MSPGRPNQQQIVVKPVWNGSTFSGQYQLTAQGDQNGVLNDTMTVNTNSTGGVDVTLNGQTASFEAKNSNRITSINLITGSGTNQVTIAGVPANVNLTVDTATGEIAYGIPSNTVNVGNGSLANIASPVTVGTVHSSDYTTLAIDNSGDSATTMSPLPTTPCSFPV